MGTVTARGRSNSIANELAQGVRTSLRRARNAYVRFTQSPFQRERNAVRSGIKAYHKHVPTDQPVYLLRRNIHMLEKGLTMVPRRDVFAMSYIGETVESYRRYSSREQMRPGSPSDEFLWMTTVLRQYFGATQGAKEPELVRLNELFTDAAAWVNNAGGENGPSTNPLLPNKVCISDLVELARGRRSVRWFDDRIVDRDKVDIAVSIAIESPTACNRQPYAFHIFDDQESVQKVAAIPMGAAGYSHQIPGLIVVVGDLSAFFDDRDRHLIYIDSCLASMGLIYGLEAQGIASCVINWPDIPALEARMRKLLKLQLHERVVMLIAYGYPLQGGLSPYSAKRNPSDARLFRAL